jgi:membrane fusion protein, copper/silver efflux system
MKNFLLGVALGAALLAGGLVVYNRTANRTAPPVAKKPATIYHCPMHPEYVSDKPGDCPVCGMKLVPVEPPTPSTGHDSHSGGDAMPAGERKPLYYADPMRPGVHFDRPGKGTDGTDLMPVFEGAPPAGPLTGTSGYATVRIPPERLQVMGIAFEEARLMEFEQSVRTVGRVAVDETRVHHIHTKFEGYIEEIFVSFVGQQVRAGQPLFSVFSPELLATQREYLLALRAEEQVAQSGEGAGLPGINLVDAARQRLALWDIEPAQIDALARTRQPIRALTLRSPVSGFVSAKTAVQGMKLMPSDTAYEVTDLSGVWLMADVYEANLPFVRVGQPVIVGLSYQPGRKRPGRVSFIDPVLDPQTRTARARIELANPDGALKPDMFADVEFRGTLGRGVGVSESAVLDTGERHVVFVGKDDGVFEPREVRIGLKVRGFYQVVGGLQAGEKVATQSNFLLDSESKLKAALSGIAHEHRQ